MKPYICPGEGMIVDYGKVSPDESFNRVANSVHSVHEELRQIYQQVRNQAHGWYRSSLIAAGVGFFLIIVAIVASIFGQMAGGAISGLAGLVSEAVAAIFFHQSNAANERVDRI